MEFWGVIKVNDGYRYIDIVTTKPIDTSFVYVLSKFKNGKRND